LLKRFSSCKGGGSIPWQRIAEGPTPAPASTAASTAVDRLLVGSPKALVATASSAVFVSNLSSHNSLSTRTLQEGWWRIFRKAALAGRSFATRDDID
jgi:hypothetical protein